MSVSTREFESPIHEIRKAKYITLERLSTMTGFPANWICTLASGVNAPIHERGPRKGQWKDISVALSEALDTPLEDLFPRYVCKLHDETNELTNTQLTELLVSAYSRIASGYQGAILEQTDLDKLKVAIEKALLGLPARYLVALTATYMDGLTLANTGKILGVSRERVKQMTHKCLRMLRHPSRRVFLEPFRPRLTHR